MDQGSLAGSKAAARHDRIHARNSAPYAKASEPRMEQVTESAGITTVFREHYKQLVPHWCAPSSTRTTSTA
jgi:hypothetical protein